MPEQWLLYVTAWCHDSAIYPSVYEQAEEVRRSYPGGGLDRNCHFWIQFVHLQTKALLLRNVMFLMPMQVQRSLVPRHANDISLSGGVWLLWRQNFTLTAAPEDTCIVIYFFKVVLTSEFLWPGEICGYENFFLLHNIFTTCSIIKSF